MPDSCAVIGEKCFDGCTKLCRVRISRQTELKEIGSFAFRGCQVCNLFLPSGLDVAATEGSFVGVRSFVIGKTIEGVMSDGCILSKDKRILCYCFSANPVFEVPDSIRRISRSCFAGSNVREVVFREKSKICDITGSFSGSSVEKIVFKGTNSDFIVEEGVMYKRDQKGMDTLLLQLTKHRELFVRASVSEVS